VTVADWVVRVAALRLALIVTPVWVEIVAAWMLKVADCAVGLMVAAWVAETVAP
jgi:hypothetical protein